MDSITELKSKLANVKAENERLKEALKFYALRKHFYGENNDQIILVPEHHEWTSGICSELIEDGFVALQALKAEASA